MNPKKIKERVIGRINELDSVNLHNFVQMLSKEHGFLDSLFNSIHEAVLLVSASHTILYHNAAAKKMLGLPDNFQTIQVERLLPGMNWNLLLNHADTGRNRTMRQELELNYPKRRIVDMYALPVERVDAPYALILNDITDTLDRAEGEAEQERGKIVSMLAAEVAHEIGNPLNSLYLHLQFLQREMKRDDFDKEEVIDELQSARSEVERLDSIINQFLKALRPGKPVFEPVDLKAIVLESLKFMQREIEDRKIQLGFYWEENVPRIDGDSNQLKQAFYNLVKNAMQAMTSGGELKIHCTADDSFVMLSVSDSGCGINRENMQKIFNPFFTTKTKGTGLGLMIVERIIRDHGGSLTIDSRENEGTTFIISLPRRYRFVRGLPPPEDNPAITSAEDETK